jgi:hypothetical protein
MHVRPVMISPAQSFTCTGSEDPLDLRRDNIVFAFDQLQRQLKVALMKDAVSAD